MTRTRTAEFTGGSMDGAVRQLPAGTETAVTSRRDGSQSHYVLDDDTGTFVFTGFDKQGASMAGIIGQFREDSRRDREAADQAARPRGCHRCGSTFSNEAAWVVHFEDGPGSRCLEGDARGQLVEVAGVLCLVGSDAAAGR